MALRHRVSNQQAAEAVETELVFPGYSSRSHTKRSRHANLLHRLALNPRLRTLLRFVRSERAVLVVLTLLAFATRFYRLAEPRAVVFDELHFGGFMEAHLQRKVRRQPLFLCLPLALVACVTRALPALRPGNSCCSLSLPSLL